MQFVRGYTSIYFAENQLFPSLISLSLRSTGHPPNFQLRWVRSSTWFYPRFNLPMDRSLGFGSTPCHSIALFGLGFPSATPRGLTLRHSVTRRPMMQKVRCRTVRIHSASTACRHTVSGTISLPLPGCFSPFPHGTCSLSVAEEYLALEDGPPRFTPGSTCPALLGCQCRGVSLSCTGLSPSIASRSKLFH